MVQEEVRNSLNVNMENQPQTSVQTPNTFKKGHTWLIIDTAVFQIYVFYVFIISVYGAVNPTIAEMWLYVDFISLALGAYLLVMFIIEYIKQNKSADVLLKLVAVAFLDLLFALWIVDNIVLDARIDDQGFNNFMAGLGFIQLAIATYLFAYVLCHLIVFVKNQITK